MKVKTNGVTRIVFVFKKYVIKIPNFTHCHLHFIEGCYANWSERLFTKQFKNVDWKWNDRPVNSHDLIAPTYFCLWFGLFSIQAKAMPMLENLTDEQKKLYEPLCQTDCKKENFGWLNGKLVCIDYP